MEPLEYFDALERLYGIDGVVRETITKVKTNKEQCQLLVSIGKLVQQESRRILWTADGTSRDWMYHIRHSSQKVHRSKTL